jgi:hypothetical protein
MFFTLAQARADNPIPLIEENVGPYASLTDALAAYPGFHEASEDEYQAYTDFYANID